MWRRILGSQGNALSSVQSTHVSLCLSVSPSGLSCLGQVRTITKSVQLSHLAVWTGISWYFGLDILPPAMALAGFSIEQSEISGFKGDLIDFHSEGMNER